MRKCNTFRAGGKGQEQAKPSLIPPLSSLLSLHTASSQEVLEVVEGREAEKPLPAWKRNRRNILVLEAEHLQDSYHSQPTSGAGTMQAPFQDAFEVNGTIVFSE